MPDQLILYGYIAAFILNAVLAGQMVYYWNSSASKATTQHKLEPKGRQAAKNVMGGASPGQASASGSNKSKKSSASTRRRG